MASRHHDPTWQESWKNQAIRDAEAAMEAAARKADKVLADANKLRVPPAQPLSDADIRKIEEGAKSSTAPRALRELQRRVDNGELSWRDIVDGKHMDDPGVRAAAEDNLSRMRRVYKKFEEGYDLNEVLDSERPAGPKERRWGS